MPRRPSTHVDSAAAVGTRLAAARKAAGLTQRDISFPGCTPAYVSRIEAGARIPSYQILREFAKRLGVSADYLATGTEAAEPDLLFEAEVALRLDDLELAEQLYEQIESSHGSEDAAAARALAGLGNIALRRGSVETAIPRLLQALEAGLPDVDAATAAEALGRAYSSQGRFGEAFDLLNRFLREAQERNDSLEVVRFSVLLANALIDSGNFGRAEAVLGDVLALARRSLDPMVRASLFWSQSRLYSSEGRPDLAAEYAQLTIATLKETEHTVQSARALLLLSHIENDRGHAEAALDLIDEGEPVTKAAGTRVDQAMFTLERARALEALGKDEEAASLALRAVGELDGASSVTAARGYAAAAGFFHSRGDNARAIELYELAAEQFPGPDRHRAGVLTAMAEIREEQGDASEALRLLKSALGAQQDASVEWQGDESLPPLASVNRQPPD